MKLKFAIVGCGIKARQYLETWIQRDDLEFVAIADLSEDALNQAASIVEANNAKRPELYTDWRELLDKQTGAIDAVYISSPHAFHADQACAALQAGADVLLEKPMVMTVEEAERLVAEEKQSGKVVVVAYQGGLSPLVHQLRDDVKAKAYGELTHVNAAVWEGWASKYSGGHWKQNIAISGGGFMFDTGAHMMNTLSVICDAEVQHISALMDNRDRPVDVVTAALGRLTDGTIFTLKACGETIDTCESRLEFFFTEAIVRVCAWGRWIEIQRAGKPIERKEQQAANNLINIFQQVRSGEINNPSSTSQGLKMAKLWDAVKLSAAKNGEQVTCK